jgi:hypothetical protein
MKLMYVKISKIKDKNQNKLLLTEKTPGFLFPSSEKIKIKFLDMDIYEEI